MNTIMDQFEPQKMLDLLTDRDRGITHLLGVPTNFLFMSQLPSFKEAKLDHLECVGVGGAAPSNALLETYSKKGLLFEHAWGMTETCSIGTTIPKHMALEKIGSCGLPALHVE
jgi:fatty-acyl-CoA synthase